MPPLGASCGDAACYGHHAPATGASPLSCGARVQPAPRCVPGQPRAAAIARQDQQGSVACGATPKADFLLKAAASAHLSARSAAVPPPPIQRVPLRACSAAKASAREALRARLANSGPTFVAPFDADAVLPPRALEDRAAAAKQLRMQLELDRRVPGVPHAALEGVIQDVLDVAGAHATAGEVGCRVNVTFIRTTMCPLLHVDMVRQRAICTLLGRGTEWLADPDVPAARSALKATVARDWAAANYFKAELERNAAFASAHERETILVRGATWPGYELHAPLHRSPELEAFDDFRLVVKVDEMDAKDGPSDGPSLAVTGASCP